MFNTHLAASRRAAVWPAAPPVQAALRVSDCFMTAGGPIPFFLPTSGRHEASVGSDPSCSTAGRGEAVYSLKWGCEPAEYKMVKMARLELRNWPRKLWVSTHNYRNMRRENSSLQLPLGLLMDVCWVHEAMLKNHLLYYSCHMDAWAEISHCLLILLL